MSRNISILLLVLLITLGVAYFAIDTVGRLISNAERQADIYQQSIDDRQDECDWLYYTINGGGGR